MIDKHIGYETQIISRRATRPLHRRREADRERVEAASKDNFNNDKQQPKNKARAPRPILTRWPRSSNEGRVTAEQKARLTQLLNRKASNG
jgi:hypothetical protein